MLPQLCLDARALVQPLGLENAWSELGEGTVEYWGHVIRVVAYDSPSSCARSHDPCSDTTGVDTSSASPVEMRQDEASERAAVVAAETVGSMMNRQDASSCGDDFDNISGGGDESQKVPQHQQQRRHQIVLEDLIDDHTPFVGENSCIVWNSNHQQLSFCLMFVTDSGFCAAWSALQALQQKPCEPIRIDVLQCCRPSPAALEVANGEGSVVEQQEAAAAPGVVVPYEEIICQGNAVPIEDAEEFLDAENPDSSGPLRRRGLGFIERHAVAQSIIEFNHGTNPLLFKDLHTCVTLLKFCNPDLTEYLASETVYPYLVKGLESASMPPETWTPPTSLDHLIGQSQKDLHKILNTSLRLHHLRHEVLPVGIDEDVTSVIDSVNHRLQNEAICALLSDEQCLKAAVNALYVLPAGSPGASARPPKQQPTPSLSSSSSPAPTDSAGEFTAPAEEAVPPVDLGATAPMTATTMSQPAQVEAFISNHLRFFSSLITLSISAFAKDLVPAVIAKICQSGLLDALSIVLDRFVLAPPQTPRKTPSRQSSAQSLNGRPMSSSGNMVVVSVDQPTAQALDLPPIPDRSQSQQSFVEDQGSVPAAPMGCKSPSPTETTNSSEGLSTCGGSTTGEVSASVAGGSASHQAPSQPPSEPRPPTGTKGHGARHHSGRAKKSSSSPSPHGTFIAYSKLIDQDITNLLEATIVRLNEKQDEVSLHEIFRVPILEHPEKHHALLTYLVKQICVPQPQASPSSTASMESGVGRNKFILYHLLGLHDDEGSSSTERILDPINSAKRDQFLALITTSYLVPACRGTSGFLRNKRTVSAEQQQTGAAAAAAPVTPELLASLGISPAFIRVLEYMLTLSNQPNQLVLLDGILHPKALVLKYMELSCRLALTSPKLVRGDVLCGNVRLLRAIFAITAADKGKYWIAAVQQHLQQQQSQTVQHPCNEQVDLNSDHSSSLDDNNSSSSSGPSIPVTIHDGGETAEEALEIRQQLANRIARTLCLQIVPATGVYASGDVLGSLFHLYKASGGARKTSLFHCSVNAMLRVMLDTDVLGNIRIVTATRYRSLLPSFFVEKCDADILQQALKAIMAKADGSASTYVRPTSSANSTEPPAVATTTSHPQGDVSPPEKSITPGAVAAAPKRSTSSQSAGRPFTVVDEMPPPPDAKQMEDMARFSPKLRSSIDRISPAPMMATLDEPVSRNESISPLPQILPHRPNSAGATGPISHIPRSPQHSSLENITASAAASPLPAATSEIDSVPTVSVSSINSDPPMDDGTGNDAAAKREPGAVKPAGSPSNASSGARRGSTGGVLTPTMPKQAKQSTTTGARKTSAGSAATGRPAGSPTSGSRPARGNDARSKPAPK